MFVFTCASVLVFYIICASMFAFACLFSHVGVCVCPCVCLSHVRARVLPRYEEQTVRESFIHTSTVKVVNVSAALDYVVFTCAARNLLGEDSLDIQLLSTSMSVCVRMDGSRALESGRKLAVRLPYGSTFGDVVRYPGGSGGGAGV